MEAELSLHVDFGELTEEQNLLITPKHCKCENLLRIIKGIHRNESLCLFLRACAKVRDVFFANFKCGEGAQSRLLLLSHKIISQDKIVLNKNPNIGLQYYTI